MRTYLVTGGAGFIGSNYIHYMFKKYDNEIRIINVDALTYAGNLENLKEVENRDNYTFVKAEQLPLVQPRINKQLMNILSKIVTDKPLTTATF